MQKSVELNDEKKRGEEMLIVHCGDSCAFSMIQNQNESIEKRERKTNGNSHKIVFSVRARAFYVYCAMCMCGKKNRNKNLIMDDQKRTLECH